MSPKLKIWTGISIAILSGLIMAPFLVLIPYYAVTSYGSETYGSDIMNWLFVIVLFSIGFHYGLRLRRGGMSQMQPIIESNIDPGTVLSFTSSISLSAYRYILVILTIGIPALIYVTLLGIFFIASSIVSRTDNFFLFAGLFFLFIPLTMLLSAGYVYRSTPSVREELKITATIDGVDLKGETYSANYRWTAITKVKEISYWFLLFIGPRMAIPVNKANLDVEKFRMILRSIPGMEKELKSEK